jgi:hypothetical protein
MKRSLLKTLSLGVAAGAIALCSTDVKAQEGATMAPPNQGMTASAYAPTPVTGTVQRYYVDRTGFVTAMDVQTADGVRMVRFSPSMASSLTSMYPVGSTASVFVTSSTVGNSTRYDLAGTGTTMPAPTSMYQPMMVSDLDVLKAEPYVMLGAKSQLYTGKVTGAISDPKTGEVLAIILDDKTMLRIPREFRHIPASYAPEGVTPLFKGSYVAANGVPEAPRYGAVSPFAERIAATSISVNGQPLGPLGFGHLQQDTTDTLFGFNIPFFGGGTPIDTNLTATQQGYTPYMAPAPSA